MATERKTKRNSVHNLISNLSTKIDFYGIKSLKIGLAGYFGKTQTTAIDGVSRNDDYAIMDAIQQELEFL